MAALGDRARAPAGFERRLRQRQRRRNGVDAVEQLVEIAVVDAIARGELGQPRHLRAVDRQVVLEAGADLERAGAVLADALVLGQHQRQHHLDEHGLAEIRRRQRRQVARQLRQEHARHRLALVAHGVERVAALREVMVQRCRAHRAQHDCGRGRGGLDLREALRPRDPCRSPRRRRRATGVVMAQRVRRRRKRAPDRLSATAPMAEHNSLVEAGRSHPVRLLDSVENDGWLTGRLDYWLARTSTTSGT